MKPLLLSIAFTAAALAQPFQVKVTGHGQPMILIPGLSSSGETWDTTVAHYRDRFQCHVLTVAGFAGVPRVPAPMLEKVREGLADYIRAQHLDRPVVVGHSLGGFVALDLAVHYPDLPGRLVIVDAYPFFAGAVDPKATPEQARENAAQMRSYMGKMTQDAYDRYVKSGVGTRDMVEKESDFERIVAWGLASDRTAVTDAMAELFSADLRDELARIKAPALVLGSWIGYKQYTDHARTEANLRAQYAKLKGVQIQVTDTAHHFIMWDDPEWMFAQIDRFLAPASTTARR
ncbi:MAG TPA: alpha/beta hydrolase [Bryobacteraceae bacterium]|jgi:pimeloyl-ACP methyl ester carboxylesterase|nr:alpha/beta hydrolase [Bryobacteraceae bacterium]